MIKFLFTVFCIVTIIGALPAQVNVSGRIGIGFYSMSSLKDYQEKRIEALSPIPAEIVTEFPPDVNYKAFISFPGRDNQTRFRFYYGFQTTGSRISLADYSGNLTLDMIVNGHMLGAEFEAFSTPVLKVINLKGYLCLGTSTTILKMRDHLDVGENKQDESYTFYSHGLDVEPGLRATYKYKKLEFGISLAYLQDAELYFYMKGNKKVKLGYDSEHLVFPGWSGVRTGFEVSFNLSGKTNTSELK
jgi:hypothetical protein